MALDIAEFCLQNVKPAGTLCFTTAAPAGGVELTKYTYSPIGRNASKAHMRMIFHLAGKSILEDAKIDHRKLRIVGPTEKCFWVPGGVASNKLGEMSVNVYFAGLGSDRYVMLKNEWYMEIHGPRHCAALTTHTYYNENKRLVVYDDTSCYIVAPVFNVAGIRFTFEAGSDGKYSYVICGEDFVLEAKFSSDGKYVSVTKATDETDIPDAIKYPAGDPAIVAGLVLPEEFASVHITREACKVACAAIEREARNWAKHFDIALINIVLPK